MLDLERSEKKRIAKSLVRDSMRIGKKADGSYESVWIRFNSKDPSCVEFAKFVEEECWKAGSPTLMTCYSSSREKTRHALMPARSIKNVDPIQDAISETVDVYMFIGEQDDPSWSESVASKFRLAAPTRQKFIEVMDRRGMRWINFGWPIPGAAVGYGCPVEKFRKIFFNSIAASFSKGLLDLCAFYKDALTGADHVQITSPDTDLAFSIKDRPVIVDDGIISDTDIAIGDFGLNIPSGEVFVAPLETTANGFITFPVVVIPGFGRIDGLRLTFEKGRVVGYTAANGTDKFAKFLESNTGDKDVIAELGIGTNPGAEFTGGSIIIDEKIYRTLHIAIGFNTGSYHGVNKASSHLDMIKDMSEGKLLVDGKVVMDGGIPAR